jgi:hypothetical protein
MARTHASDDLRLVILAEYTFLAQELMHCDPSDAYAAASLKQAIQSFDDALAALQVVENGEVYRMVDMTYPRHPKYRHKDMPKDAFHIACLAHKTRLDNSLRSTGVNLVEKELIIIRKANLIAAQEGYLERQRAAVLQRGGG